MAINEASFRARFPEFVDTVTYPSATIDLFIQDSIDIYMGSDENRWAGKYDYAQSYLVAHLLTLATFTAAGDSKNKGGIQSKAAGGVSVTFQSSDNSKLSIQDQKIMSTSYGQEYIGVRNICFVGVLNTI